MWNIEGVMPSQGQAHLSLLHVTNVDKQTDTLQSNSCSLISRELCPNYNKYNTCRLVPHATSFPIDSPTVIWFVLPKLVTLQIYSS